MELHRVKAVLEATRQWAIDHCSRLMRLILSYWTFKKHILGGRISEGAGLWTLLPSTNKLCHAVSLHMRVCCLGGVSALLCMIRESMAPLARKGINGPTGKDGAHIF